jgi:AraC-like DNA-binding protein
MSSVLRAGALRGFPSLARELGVDPEPLLRRRGIDPQALAAPESLVSLEATADVMEDLARASGHGDVGLRLTDHQGPAVVGPLAIALLNAKTPAQALADAARYLFVQSPAYELTVEDPGPLGSALVRFDVHVDARRPRRQLVDGVLSTAWRLAQAVAGDGLRLDAVWLPHTPAAPASTYTRFFGGPVAFSQPFAGLHVPRSFLSLDLARADPLLRSTALEYLSAQAPPPDRQLADRVRHALRRTLGAGPGTRAQIADLLYVHPRTLHRALAREGTTFEALRDEVYADALLHHLRDTDVPLGQLAGVLGYSDQAAITRACRRWLGDTPGRVRRRERGR